MTDEARKAQKILTRLWHWNSLIDSQYDQISRLRSIATRATTSYNALKVSGTNNRSRVEDGAIAIMESSKKLDKLIDRLLTERERAKNALDLMDDRRERTVLEMRYLEHPHRSWWEIMGKLNISKTTSFRVHESALVNFYRALKNGSS